MPVTALVLVMFSILCVIIKKLRINESTETMPINSYKTEYVYDSFICYSDDDEHLIQKLIEILEGDEHKMVLCVHKRDFNPGAPVCLNIDGAIRNSRSTIIILSKNFLRSGWCRKEFEVAITQQSHTPNYKVVVVCIDDPRHYRQDEVPTYILRFVSRRTYIQYNSRHFYLRLAKCLPRPDETVRKAGVKRGAANLVPMSGGGIYGSVSTSVNS